LIPLQLRSEHDGLPLMAPAYAPDQTTGADDETTRIAKATGAIRPIEIHFMSDFLPWLSAERAWGSRADRHRRITVSV
jgi:hypothetical protein